jgi:hypothetical protein
MPQRGDEAMDAFLLSLSHGPLAIVLPILWLLSLPASIFAFKRLCKFPLVVSFWARALILATQLLLTVLVFLGLSHFQCGREVAWQNRCAQNLRAISLAIAKYAQDWDERLPPARRWVDAISERHLKRDDIPQIFRCPKSSSPFSYAFNISLDRVSILQVGYPSETVLLFECDASSLNAFGDQPDLPQRPRHLEGDIYAFVDGHAKWIRRSNVFNLRWKP